MSGIAGVQELRLLLQLAACLQHALKCHVGQPLPELQAGQKATLACMLQQHCLAA